MVSGVKTRIVSPTTLVNQTFRGLPAAAHRGENHHLHMMCVLFRDSLLWRWESSRRRGRGTDSLCGNAKGRHKTSATSGLRGGRSRASGHPQQQQQQKQQQTRGQAGPFFGE